MGFIRAKMERCGNGVKSPLAGKRNSKKKLANYKSLGGVVGKGHSGGLYH